MKKAISRGMLSVFMVLASALVIGCITAEGLDYSCEDDTSEVIFADDGLDAAVREALPDYPTGAILQKNLCDLTQLDASARSITDLSGIEHCKALTDLALGGSGLGLSALTDGTSRATTIPYNQISDISELSGLTELEYLDLRNNLISDIGALLDNDGLGEGDVIDLRNNSLDSGDCDDINELRDRGATVYEDVCTS